MTTTLLAIDDSKTMRKVMEITFHGEDFNTVLAESSADALTKLQSAKPAVALVDAKLGSEDGYELCQRLKQASPGLAVLILSSKHQPYDPAKGSSAGADGFMDKPFDTQKLIDKVGELVGKARTGATAAAAPGAVTTASKARAPTLAYGAQRTGQAAAQPAAAKPAARPAAAPAQRPVAAAQPAARPAPAPQPAARPAPAPQPAARPAVATKPAAPAARPAAAAAPTARAPVARQAPAPTQPSATAAAPMAAAQAKAAGDLASQLSALNLSKDQVDAVLKLSSDVIEKVVWEVVPVLAETMIREEIRRLTSD